MKKQEFETSNGRFVLVDVTKHISEAYKDPDTFYKLICKLSEATEEQAEMVVDKSIHSGLFAHYVKDIPVNTYCYKSSLESLHSLIRSLGVHLYENPIKEPKGEDYYYENNVSFDEVETLWDGGSYKEDLDAYNEAEPKTYYNPFIFKIV